MNKIDLRHVDLNLLPVFTVLMEECHVSRAAERLGRTQSAVSHALERLREQLGDPLLVRVGGAMRPSPFALELIGELRPLLQHVQRILAPREAFEPATSERTFRVVLPDFWSDAVARFLALAGHIAPAISLEWLAPRETSLVDLAAGQVDLVVAPSQLAHPEGVHSEPLGALVWQSFVRSGHPAIGHWSRKAWLTYPHIVVAVGDRLQSPVQSAHGLPRAKRRVGARVPNFSAVAPLLARTDMIATLPTMAVGQSAVHHELVALQPPIEIPPIAHSLYWSSQQANEPSLRWLRETLLPLLAIPACEGGASQQ
jgi:DNA-binding transcriptional LysR family regulator